MAISASRLQFLLARGEEFTARVQVSLCKIAGQAFERHDVLLEKVEELTTYIIEQQHEINSLKARIA